MHKSRLAGFIIDCQTDDLGQAGQFWSRALVVMEAPTGQRFCVVRVQRSDFEANANIWT